MTSYGLEALRAIHTEDISPVVHSLTLDEWAAPSACAGWRNQDLVAHLTTNMKLFVDPDPQPDDAGPAVDGIEAMQDMMVDTRRDWTADQVLGEYDQFLDPWLGAVAAFQDEPLASSETDLGQLGTHPMHRFADIYAFDHLCHLRVDLLGPAGSVVRDLPAVDELRMRPTVEWMMLGLPSMCREALAAVTAPVQLELTGPGASMWLIGPGPAVTQGSAEAAATVASSAEDFVSWGTKRSDWRSACQISGDEALAAVTADAINII